MPTTQDQGRLERPDAEESHDEQHLQETERPATEGSKEVGPGTEGGKEDGPAMEGSKEGGPGTEDSKEDGPGTEGSKESRPGTEGSKEERAETEADEQRETSGKQKETRVKEKKDKKKEKHKDKKQKKKLKQGGLDTVPKLHKHSSKSEPQSRPGGAKQMEAIVLSVFQPFDPDGAGYMDPTVFWEVRLVHDLT